MESISLEQVLVYYDKIIKATGGTPGIRDKSKIDSALMRGFASYDGEYLYKSNIEKISAITHSMISNHPFTDGNKRIGVATMLLLLKLNNITIEYSQEELINFGLGIASGNLNFEDIANWIKVHKVA